MLFLGCFYSLFVTEYHERDRKGSLVDHYLCITVTAAHLICYWTSWNHIEPVFVKRSKQKLLCIFYTQLAKPAGQWSTIEYPYIASKSYNCYCCHFPEGRNFLRNFSKSPRPTMIWYTQGWEKCVVVSYHVLHFQSSQLPLIRPTEKRSFNQKIKTIWIFLYSVALCWFWWAKPLRQLCHS